MATIDEKAKAYAVALDLVKAKAVESHKAQDALTQAAALVTTLEQQYASANMDLTRAAQALLAQAATDNADE